MDQTEGQERDQTAIGRAVHKKRKTSKMRPTEYCWARRIARQGWDIKETLTHVVNDEHAGGSVTTLPPNAVSRATLLSSTPPAWMRNKQTHRME